MTVRVQRITAEEVMGGRFDVVETLLYERYDAILDPEVDPTNRVAVAVSIVAAADVELRITQDMNLRERLEALKLEIGRVVFGLPV